MKSGWTPTEAGAEVLVRRERIVGEFDEARDAVAAHRSEIVDRLRIAAPNSFANLLAPTFVALGQRHPKLEIDTSFTDRMVDLTAERFDVVIRVGQLPDSTMIARRVAPVHSMIVASPEYIAQAGYPRTPSELVDHSCLIYAAPSGNDWKLRVANRWTQVHVTGRFRSDNGETLVQWAMAGLGVCNAPALLVEDKIASGELVRLLEEFPAPEYGMFAVRPSGTNAPARVRILIESFVERFGQPSASR